MSTRGERWRLMQPVGFTLITLGFVGTLVTFPFIYGDPAPGQEATDPSWFFPVATGLWIAIALGIVLVCASSTHRLVLRRSGRTGSAKDNS